MTFFDLVADHGIEMSRSDDMSIDAIEIRFRKDNRFFVKQISREQLCSAKDIAAMENAICREVMLSMIGYVVDEHRWR